MESVIENVEIPNACAIIRNLLSAKNFGIAKDATIDLSTKRENKKIMFVENIVVFPANVGCLKDIGVISRGKT